MIKISQTVWTHFVVFLDDNNNVLHSVGYVGFPNVASLKENFEELAIDEDFKIDNIDSAFIAIVDKNTYIGIVGDFEVDVDYNEDEVVRDVH